MKMKYTIEILKKEALKYKTRGEFQKKANGAYNATRRKGILDTICSHMPTRIDISGSKNPAFKWSLVKIQKEALRYKSRKEFFSKNGSAYNAAKRMDILDQVCSHMPKNMCIGQKPYNFKWTLEKIKKEALKYKTRSEFKTKSSGAYQVSTKQGILDLICSHMKYMRHYRSNEDIYKIAKKYDKLALFHKNDSAVYQAANKRGILDLICAHMKKVGDTSILEIDLFLIIKSLYSKTQKFKDRKVIIEGKPHIMGFDIDIYVPELRKGIEFDGKYWHSEAGLKRSRMNWPQEDIDNYHQLKDDWFKSKGIQILHIKEQEWIKDKKKCIKECLYFLGSKSSSVPGSK